MRKNRNECRLISKKGRAFNNRLHASGNINLLYTCIYLGYMYTRILERIQCSLVPCFPLKFNNTIVYLWYVDTVQLAG